VARVSRPAGRPARALAWVVVHLRFLVVAAWVAAAVLATIYLPPISEADGSSLASMLPKDSAAVATEQSISRIFGLPLFSRLQVVQRDPHGLSPAAQARVVRRAVELDSGRLKERFPDILGAIPVLNTARLLPGSRESGTTAVTYVFADPRLDIFGQRDALGRYVRAEISRPEDHLVGVTGAVAARVDEANRVASALPWVQLATVALIGLIVGFHFRSVGAPFVTLAAAAIAYLITIRVLVWLGQRAHVSIPQEIEPLVVVLLLGIVTDYSVFYLSGMRTRLSEGRSSVRAAKATSGELARIILTAGMVVAAPTAALLVTPLTFFRALGPGLAVTVAIGLVVSVTFVPAAMALGGRALFWPARPQVARPASGNGGAAVPVDAEDRAAPDTTLEPAARSWRGAAARAVTRRPVALVVCVVVVGGLAVAASFLRQTGFGISLTDELPNDSEAARAAVAAGTGFAPGITSPMEVLVRGPGVAHGADRLARLNRLVAAEPGVAGVIGPGTLPPRLTPSVFLSGGRSAARFVVILDRDPLGSSGLREVGTLEHRMPDLLRRAGLGGASAGFAGDSALARETVGRTLDAIGLIAGAALIADFVLLAIFLRALLAPVYLLAASALVVGASIGLTTLVFQDWAGHPGLTYYVPFAVAVLLVALGSDYNVFVVGRIWQEARWRPLREAIRMAAPRASRAIGVAGLALAGSFALLALVPLTPFREFAFAMAVGVLLDSFVVRTLLVPALMTLFGRDIDRAPAEVRAGPTRSRGAGTPAAGRPRGHGRSAAAPPSSAPPRP
jgi:putative drug exporter of the RND superfamily